jgi:V8-like Glu-specific endopeptidase
MSDSLHPLHSSIVRFRDAEGAIVGAGFLATPDLVCTCAHVVADALHLPRETAHLPEQEVHLDFPSFDGAQGQYRLNKKSVIPKIKWR